MFSIAPFLINSKSELSKVTIGDVTGSTKLLVPGRTTAAGSIPRGATTLPIDPKQLCGRSEIIQITVKTNEFGTIELDKSSRSNWSSNLHWIRALRLSDDCHSCNIQLKLQSSENKNIADSKLILQTIRPIQNGEELLLWFSEDILALIQMVFLTPANIQGQKKYVCTRCLTYYESPNPLKLHIVLNCGRLSISDLWSKISSLLLENKKYSFADLHNTEFTFKLTPDEICVSKQSKAMDLSVSNHLHDLQQRPLSQPYRFHSTNSSNSEDSQILHRPYSEPLHQRSSAFKPFQKLSIFDDESQTADLQLNYELTPQTYWSGLTLNQSFYNHSSLLANNINSTDEAHIETVVSSLGKSKEGHICLYCGKCYSRKYGLKIHIRTHTGYKPLKCKFCSRPFGDPSNLNKHVRLHAEGDTPYKCELCGKILVRRRDLERHLKSRHMSEIHPGRNMVEDANSSEADITDEDLTVDR